MLDLTLEYKILLTQLEVLKKEFSELFERKNEMISFEEPYLTALYLDVIGRKQYELYCLKIDLMKLKQRIQLAQIYFNRNQLPDWEKIDLDIKISFESQQKKINEEAERLKNAHEFLKSNRISKDEVEKIKKTYWVLVKKLHPDINPDLTAYENDLFIKVQAAYHLSDLIALEEILLSLDNKKEDIHYPVDNLKTKVDKLNEKIEHLKKQIFDLDLNFPFKFRDQLKDKNWIKSEQETTQSQMEEMLTEILQLNEYLLLLKSWKPELLH